MTQAMQDLWPSDFGGVEESPPMSFLKQQASLLGEKTGHLVEAEVTSTADTGMLASHLISDPDDPVVVLGFVLKAPAIANYRYMLFRAYHAADQFYPMLIRFGREELQVSSQDELAEHLRDIFSANETRKVIGTLIAQSKAMTG